jgi:hypothetical protein
LVGRRSSVVALVEPTGNRVASKADHAAAKPHDLDNQGIIDRIDLLHERLDAATCAQRTVECLGERGKPCNIGEQRHAAGLFGQRFAARQRLPAILRKIGGQHRIHGRSFHKQ